VIAVIHRFKILKPRGLVASLPVMPTAALATALVSVLVAYTPALAQSTVADTKHPRVIEVRPAEGATGVSPTSGEFSEGHKVVAFFSEDMRPSSAMRAIRLYKKGSGNLEDATMGYNAAKRKVTLWPPNPLKRGVTYKAVVSTRAKDLAGNGLDQNRNRAGLQPKVWYFTIEEE
jgi:Bacterial Ig-like domain